MMNVIEYLDNPVATAFYGQFRQLREPQLATIEPLILGKNVILTSGTGSGKTEAVMAPLVSKYWRQAINNDSLFLLYIAPTKALVNDLEKRLYSPLLKIGLRVGIRHGDRDDLISGAVPHVLITTPESLEVLLFRKEPTLQTIKAVVIDEVHLLYNTQRGLQLSILLNRLRRFLNFELQWAALSATIGDLSNIRDFLKEKDENTVFLEFKTERIIDAKILHISSMQDFLSLINKLTQENNVKLLVFANSRRECEKLTGVLQEDKKLQNCVFTHYSSLSPEVRIDTERKFSSMGTTICIATSTLELGIDIGDIDAVLLWDVPATPESFLQRIGRGNRRSNKTNVVCLIPDDLADTCVKALRFAALIDISIKGELPIREPYDLFGAVGQQCLSIIASNGGRFTRISELCNLVGDKTYLTRDIVENILGELATNGFLKRHGYKNQYGADEDLYKLVDMKLIYGNFGVGSQTISLFHGSKHLGEVPAANLLRIRRNTHVRFAGKPWKILKVSSDGIHLEPSRSNVDTLEFAYGGNSISSDPYITDRIWQLIHSDNIPMDLFDKDLRGRVLSFIRKIRQVCSEKQIPYQQTEEGFLYYTFAGDLLNRALGLFLHLPDFKADDITLFAPFMIDWALIPNQCVDFEEYFHLFFEISSKQSIYQKNLPYSLQEREYIQDWLKDKTIIKTLSRLSKAEAVQIMGF